MPTNTQIVELLNQLYHEKAKIFNINNFIVMKKMYRYFIHTGQFSKCYNFIFNDYKVLGRYCHYYDLAAEQLYDIDISDPFVYADYINDVLYEKIDPQEKNIINNILNSHKKLIGIHYETYESGHGELGNKRFWNKAHVCTLINKATDDIEYVLLNDSEDSSSLFNNIKSIAGLSTCATVFLISKLDYVIGIDGYCGHIAALFNIPSITLWNKQTPTHLSYDEVMLSFRVMRNNISVVPLSGNTNDISGEQVHDIFCNNLKNITNVKNDVFSSTDIFNNKDVIYV